MGSKYPDSQIRQLMLDKSFRDKAYKIADRLIRAFKQHKAFAVLAEIDRHRVVEVERMTRLSDFDTARLLFEAAADVAWERWGGGKECSA